MFRTALHLFHKVTHRRCPSCGRVEVRRSARKNFFEAALLPILLTRPFRCENCGNRFFGLAFRRRIPAPDYATPMADVPQGLPVLVYGRRRDEEPFREETNLHLLNLRGGLITLGTSVEPGQQLILMNLDTEEDQRCRVAFVGEEHLGRSMIGIQFNWLTQEFWQP
jgi:ribosomal protein L37AE/L43A